MLISFQNMKEVAVPKCRGGEKELFRRHVDTGDNQIMLARLEPGASVGIHTHEDDSETIYYLSGKGKVYYDGRYESVQAGVCHHCPKGQTHGTFNDGDEDLVFFAVIPKQ